MARTGDPRHREANLFDNLITVSMNVPLDLAQKRRPKVWRLSSSWWPSETTCSRQLLAEAQGEWPADRG